jgi:hypothetical protein
MKKVFLQIDGASILNKVQLQSISAGWEGGPNPSVCSDGNQGAQCGPHHSCTCEVSVCVDDWGEFECPAP